MKFTLSWLAEHLDSQATLNELVDKLTQIGLEVEGVDDPRDALSPFTIAHVVKAEKHPNADRLSVCQVDNGDGVFQVVCGAPNARTGMKGVFAPSGTHIPGTGLDLKPAMIRGVESNGMLCSEREMMLSDDHDGIIDLDENAPVGDSFAEYAGLNDPIIDIAITPNRQDCLGVHGIARDLAAAGMGRAITPEPRVLKGGFASPIGLSLEFDDESASACPVFAGRYIRGLKNGPSPDWLQRRLRAIGLRPISALVDITNFITFDRGRPLHVYDADKVKGHMGARLAGAGEVVEALDGKSYVLEGEECVIFDASGAVGLAGVIGGDSTGCSDDTVNVFVECAWFDPVRTAMTGRMHNIISDARYRFERGVDPAFVLPGMEFATRLILDLCGGDASEVVVAGAPPIAARSVNFRPSRVRSLGGLDVDREKCREILTDLGFGCCEGNESFSVSIPEWRRDVDGEADLVEEVLRITGYDNIPACGLTSPEPVATPVLSPLQKRARMVRRRLAISGLEEAVSFSFMPRGLADLFRDGGEEILLENPISSELDAMRPSILPNLLQAAGRNLDRGAKSVALFELGPQYRSGDVDGQDLVAAGVRAAQRAQRHWSLEGRTGHLPDMYDAKADALAALEAAGAPVDKLMVAREAPSWYHPGRSAVFKLGPTVVLARFGEIHPAVLTALDLDARAVGFELFTENIPTPRRKTRGKGALGASDLPRVERDFAFVVSDEVNAGEILRLARSAAKAHVHEASVFDIFRGGDIPDGAKSVAISIILEPKKATFTETELEIISAKIVNKVCDATGGQLRG